MFDEAADQFDAAVVATPDHTHAIIAAAALRAGKPVLTEKPLTISAHEARSLHQLAKERKLPTQMNNGGTASPGFRRGLEIIREGTPRRSARRTCLLQSWRTEFSEAAARESRGPQGVELEPLVGAGEVARVPPGMDQPGCLARYEHRRVGELRSARCQHGLHGATCEGSLGRAATGKGRFASRLNAPM